MWRTDGRTNIRMGKARYAACKDRRTKKRELSLTDINDLDRQQKVRVQTRVMAMTGYCHWDQQPAAPRYMIECSAEVCTWTYWHTILGRDQVYDVTNDDHRFTLPVAMNWHTAKRSMNIGMAHRKRAVPVLAAIRCAAPVAGGGRTGRCMATSVNKHQQWLAYCEPTSRLARAASGSIQRSHYVALDQ